MIKGRQLVTIEQLYEKYTDIQILSYYLNIKKIPIVISSPFRRDKKPSFSLYSKNGVSIFYKDFATNEYGSTIQLMARYFNISLLDTCLKIYKELDNKNINSDLTIKAINSNNSSNFEINNTVFDSKLQIKIRDFQTYDSDYWDMFGISIPLLRKAQIYPISHFFIGNITYKADKLAYAYIEEKDKKHTIKIYQPYNVQYKWFSNNNSSVIDLWNLLPNTGDTLIITSSKKDSLCIINNLGIPTINLQSEGTCIKKKIMMSLKERFKNIYVLYDNDFKSDINYGRNFSKKFADKYNLYNIFIPDELKSKDPSDLYKNHGKEMFKLVILKLLNDTTKDINII